MSQTPQSVVPATLLPQRLAAAWEAVEAGKTTPDDYNREYERLLGAARAEWEEALLLHGEANLEQSLLSELAGYLGISPAVARGRCQGVARRLEREWQAEVGEGGAESVERFYDRNQTHLYELTWWHTLSEDSSPLAYVVALDFARKRGCRRYLDFGAGVGSGAILFARDGLETSLADISGTMLDFSRWRFQIRDLSASFIDLKTESLPARAFDLIAAMDVFEHLVDPVRAVDELHAALRPGGLIFGRFAVEPGDDRSEHIVRDIGPVVAHFRDLGMEQIWEDGWLWGHRAYQRVG